MERKCFDCACFSDEHAVTLQYLASESDVEVGLSVQLIPYAAWYRRVWAALKYIFGCNEGHLEYFQIHSGENLNDVINFLIEAREAKWRKRA